MSNVNMMPHQIEVLNETSNQNKVAYYLDMGLGKTYVGAEKMMQLNNKINLVICQKSKVDDWLEHFNTYYKFKVFDLTKPKQLSEFHGLAVGERFTIVGVINYDLVFRRPELLTIEHFTLMLDESSLIQNETAKRSKFILRMNPDNVILLSGTPTSGKYEKLWSQLHLLGWNISKKLYWTQYVETKTIENDGFPIKVVTGYKNVDRLKRKLREHGAIFMKTEDVLNLPEKIEQMIRVCTTKEYRKFRKDAIVKFNDIELVGDTTLTKMLYERQLCGQYNQDKLDAFQELLESTEDRIIVFYNFNSELELLMDLTDRPISLVNGQDKNLECYEEYDNSVTFIQYQAGAMGLNLQKANKIIYFTPPLSSEIFEQSKKRVHRIGQNKSCFYYYMCCRNSVEEKIYDTLAMRKNFTDKLFEEVI